MTDTDTTLKVVTKLEVRPDYRLRIAFADARIAMVDFRPIIARGGVFASLASPDFFAQVAIGEGGRYIQWPKEIDFCADALWLCGQQSRAEPANAIESKRPAAFH